MSSEDKWILENTWYESDSLNHEFYLCREWVNDVTGESEVTSCFCTKPPIGTRVYMRDCGDKEYIVDERV